MTQTLFPSGQTNPTIIQLCNNWLSWVDKLSHSLLYIWPTYFYTSAVYIIQCTVYIRLYYYGDDWPNDNSWIMSLLSIDVSIEESFFSGTWMLTYFMISERLEALLSTIITFTSFYRGHTLPTDLLGFSRSSSWTRCSWTEGDKTYYDVNSQSSVWLMTYPAETEPEVVNDTYSTHYRIRRTR